MEGTSEGVDGATEEDNKRHLIFLEDNKMDVAPIDLPSLDIVHNSLGVDANAMVVSQNNLLLNILGLQATSQKWLSDVGQGKEKQPLEQNDKWAMRQAHSLQSALNWNMNIPFIGGSFFRRLEYLIC